MSKPAKVTYEIAFGMDTIRLIDSNESFFDERAFTEYLDQHKWAKAPMAFPQINLLINTFDPVGCKCNSWRNHLKVLLANGFNIQAIGANEKWILKKDCLPIQYQFQKTDQSMVHFGYFFRFHDQTADEQFPNYCEAADYPPGMMRTIALAHFNSGNTLWATSDLKSEILVRPNEDGRLFSLDETMTYLSSKTLSKAQ